jgi:hypothetical protein
MNSKVQEYILETVDMTHYLVKKIYAAYISSIVTCKLNKQTCILQILTMHFEFCEKLRESIEFLNL